MDDDGQNGARQRAERRCSWPVRKYRLGSEPSDDLSASTTPEQRLEMMWPLALEAWSLAGKPIPEYPRCDTPLRWFRRRLA